MFTIRSGALALFLTALLTQNAQVQAGLFSDLFNIVRKNPKTAGIIALGMAYGAYKLFARSEDSTPDYLKPENQRVYVADLHNVYKFSLEPYNGGFCLAMAWGDDEGASYGKHFHEKSLSELKAIVWKEYQIESSIIDALKKRLSLEGSIIIK